MGFFIALPSRIVVCRHLRLLSSAYSLLCGVYDLLRRSWWQFKISLRKKEKEQTPDWVSVLFLGSISAYESDDDGRSWSYLSSVRFPDSDIYQNLHEPYAIELEDGSILGMIRAQGEEIADALGEMNDDLKKYKFTMFKTFSRDGGRSWTDPEPMGFLGAPPHMLLHSSGAIILTYSRRKVGTQGVFARVSRDGGVTFGEETLIGPEAYIWDQGYPSTVELDGGSLLTVYYQRYEDDPFCSVLYSKWTLDEIK